MRSDQEWRQAERGRVGWAGPDPDGPPAPLSVEERQALSAAAPIILQATVQVRAEFVSRGTLAGQVLALGIELAADRALELLGQHTMVSQAAATGSDGASLLRSAVQLLDEIPLASGSGAVLALRSEVRELLVEAAVDAQ
jgi:hypothetical protein